MASKVNFNKLASDTAVLEAINSLHNRSDNLQLDIHKVLVAIAANWHKGQDYRPVVLAVNTLLAKGKMGGVRTNAIRAWVETFLGLKVIEDGDDKGKFMCPKPKNNGQHLVMDMLVNKRWWEFKPEAEYKPLDFDKLWNALVKQADTRLKAGTKEGDKIDAGLLAAMQKARQEYLASKG